MWLGDRLPMSRCGYTSTWTGPEVEDDWYDLVLSICNLPTVTNLGSTMFIVILMEGEERLLILEDKIYPASL